MKNQHITILCGSIIIIIFALYFYILFIYADVDERMKSDLINVQQASIEGNKQKLTAEFDNLLSTWNTIKYILAFNFASEEYYTLSNTIDKIQGAIIASDDQTVIIATAEAESIFKNFIKFLPAP